MPPLDKTVIEGGFGKVGLEVFNTREELEAWLNSRTYQNAVLLLMSSGNYEGINAHEFAEKITGS
jgi:UDP-N-acetylmuramate: L-alanyl-gamma-D-glutamyl-meso-diaminopimelate ligase